MKSVCVFAGSSGGARPEYVAAAQELGRALVRRNASIVYGGGRVGLMGALADAALAAGGKVIGVIPEALVARERAHPGVADMRVVASMHERKAMMADLAEGFIALPGGWGTLEETFEILTWAQLGLHRKPCGALNVSGYYDRLLAFLEHAVDEGFVPKECSGILSVASTCTALLDAMAAYRPPAIERWIERSQT